MEVETNEDVLKNKLFDEIIQRPDVFYRSQQRDEPEISVDEKRSILNTLFNTKPAVFLERYHNLIDKEYIDCFPKNERCQPYLNTIEMRKNNEDSNNIVRNRRFMAMQQLKEEGDYFSLSKMRERCPFEFDTMVADHLRDSEKLQLRPTVDSRQDSGFANLMEQFDESQRITERRKRHFAEWENCMSSSDKTDRFLAHVSQRMEVDDDFFEMEFDSDDNEAEIKRKRCISRYYVDKELPENILPEPIPSTSSSNIADETTRQISKLSMAEREIHPEDPTQIEGKLLENDSLDIEHDALIDEFRSFMEQRFLNGEDGQFVDYEKLDQNNLSVEFSKLKERDLEDAYFADNES